MEKIINYIILSDQQLVLMVRDGDSDAFEALFNRYRDSLRKLLQSRVANNEDAEDLLQDTFVKVFLNIDKYDERYTFGQWVYTIARNTFIDYIRRRRDEVSTGSYSQDKSSVAPSSDASPEERFISIQSNNQIEGYMNSLSPKYRRLIELRFYKEYSYEEIASELGMPIGTVKTQIHRAREQLCKLISAGGLY